MNEPLVNPIALPYLKIFIQPADVMRSLLYFKPREGIFLISFLFGIANFLIPSSMDDIGFGNYLLIISVLAPLALINGLCWIYGYTYILYLCSLLLRQPLAPKNIRQVVAWSWLPGLLGAYMLAAIAFLFLALFGPENSKAVESVMNLCSILAVFLILWTYWIQLVGFHLLTNSWKVSVSLSVMPAALCVLVIFLSDFMFQWIEGI